MRLIECSETDHADAILEILNEAITNSTALYDYKPRTRESMQGWFELKRSKSFPVVGAVDEHDRLLGFASYGTFRAFPAYKYTVEHSVYVQRDLRRGGVGLALMRELIQRARTQEYHLLVGGIDMQNEASIRFHEKLGFVHAGTIRQAGFKFGRWLDLGFYQLLLDTPAAPVDG
ncbi:MAG: GNAT family N-acetyltransferase [Myxococcota bacterium]